MRRDTFKLLVFAAIVGFAILYGMELSSKGIENVNGPMESANPSEGRATTVDEGDWTLPPRETAQDNRVSDRDAERNYWGDEEEYAVPRNDREPIVDRVSGKTADVLHDLSRNGIRMVVSIFDRVTG
ncbi:hypothetical protein [Cohnella lupini]|uniref:Uncharacterized protein n=1 Tax=Cohnella lupini TaxID=1294267 RepID=A0A3D9IV87_9BACL|nr:hypothetical protein [Cohnella lupini]RED65690.1 hypothetical protein DFP95_101179 [Cohnella lupini]